ncbi:jg5210, partial [Pararge aegeria aegeria]
QANTISRAKWVYIRRVNSAARPAPTATARRISRENVVLERPHETFRSIPVLPRAPCRVLYQIGLAQRSLDCSNNTEEALRDLRGSVALTVAR